MEKQSPKRVVLPPPDTRYLREQKAAFALVGITGGLAVLLGIFFLVDHITSPLSRQYVGPRLLTSAERQREELEKQAVTDTDGDGLTDFEELYNYRTSPYLVDTDGDTILDGVEVAAGTDPSCPQGEDCSGQQSGDLVDVPILDVNDTASQSQADLLLSQIENLTPAEIRELLIASGASAEDIAAVPDAELVSVYTQTLRQLEESGELQRYLTKEWFRKLIKPMTPHYDELEEKTTHLAK